MSTLQDLKKAAAAKQEAQEAEAAKQKESEAFRLEARPKMKEVFRYFKELVDTLNQLEQDIQRDLHLEGVGTLSSMQQGTYFITAPTDNSFSEVKIGFTCTGKRPLVMKVNTPLSLNHQKDFLFNNEIKFKLVEKRDNKGDLVEGRFEISPIIACSLKFRIDPEVAVVFLAIRNIGRLGERRVKLKLGHLKESFFDEVVKLILTKPSKLDIKEKLDIDDDTKRRLQEKLKEQEVQKVEETKKEKGLFGSLFKR